MRLLFYLLILGGGIWAFTRYVSSDMRHRALARVGLAEFVEETAPNYLRTKFSIRESPVEKRARLLAELSAELDAVGESVGKLAPKNADGTLSPLPSNSALRKEAEYIQNAVTKAEALLATVNDANAEEGIIRATTVRLLDVILPVSKATGTPPVCPE